MADPGFLDRGRASLDRGRQFEKGRGRQVKWHIAVCGRNLKKRLSLAKIGEVRSSSLKF